MALSGTINGSVTQKSNYFSFYLTWSATQSVSGNYSDVTVKTYWKTNNTYQGFDTVGSRNASITINGTTQSITKAFNVCASGSTSWATNPYLIQTTTQRVYHNNDGTKSITISARANGYADIYGPSSSTASSADCTASGTITLNTIPRASTITSVGNVTLGNACSVIWTPASSNFKYKIKFSLGSWSYTTDYISPSVTSAYTYDDYTIPNTSALLDDIPNSTTGTMTATLYTYNSSNTQIGSASSKTFTVTVPSSVVPTVGTITVTPQTYSYLIQNKNTVKVSVSGCTAGTGSSIKSYTFSGPGLSSTTTSTSATSSVISSSGTKTYTVTVTDNRGRTASKTASVTCYAYSQPSILLDAYRVASSTSTTENDSGTYVRCTYSLTFSSVNNANDITVKILYKKSSASSWSSVTVLTDSKATSGSYILSGIDAASTYTVYATVTDNYGGSVSSIKDTVFATSRTLNITSDGTGIAIGKMSEKTSSHTNGLFECAFDTQLYNDLNVDGDITVDGAVKIGGNLTINSKTLLDLLHPVGSIYQSTASTNPETLFGGTWEQLSGKFLIAANSIYTAGSTGGEASHTLTVAEMPAHQGHMYDNFNESGYVDRNGDTNSYYVNSSASGYGKYENRPYKIVSGNEFVMQGYTRGGSQAHNNLPPYLAVYMWKRTK